jgi:hypothetical protein
MATVFVEARPKGRPEGSPIEGYVVEAHADNVLHVCNTQEEAIAWAKQNDHIPHVARVRHLNDKNNRITCGRYSFRRLREVAPACLIAREDYLMESKAHGEYLLYP